MHEAGTVVLKTWLMWWDGRVDGGTRRQSAANAVRAGDHPRFGQLNAPQADWDPGLSVTSAGDGRPVMLENVT